MTKVMKDVKKVEDDLVKKESQLEKKEKQLEQKVEEDEQKSKDANKKDDDGWGSSEEVHQLPLMPHFGPPKSFGDMLHDLGEHIQQRVKNMRRDMADKEHAGKDANPLGEGDSGFPHIRIIRMHHPPPLFPSFLNFDDDN